MNRFQQELNEKETKFLKRSLPSNSNLVDFFSNDYLGFARSNDLKDRIKSEFDSKTYSNGSTGSRLLSGNDSFYENVESIIAEFFSVDSALIFNSGYDANVGLLSSIGTRSTTFICDEFLHASLIDGMRLSHSRRTKFQHNDIADLESKLSKTEGEKFVVVESIYSMDGDMCPLQQVYDLCQKYSAELIVDEAHAIGVIGRKGQGLSHKLGLHNKLFAMVITFGKALGVHGAAVLGSQWMIDYLINSARSFIFTTAPSPHQLVSIKSALGYLEHSSDKKESLSKNVAYFVSKRQTSQLKWKSSNTQIQSVLISGNEKVIEFSDKLKDAGYAILPIRYPTVPDGSECLRISIHAFNTKDEIDGLFENLEI